MTEKEDFAFDRPQHTATAVPETVDAGQLPDPHTPVCPSAPAAGPCASCASSSQGCCGGQADSDACCWGDGHLRGLCAKGCGRSDRQLNTYDYLADVPGNLAATDFVEVQFKNTRKGFYRNDNHLDLQKGDVVAVEAQPGHDIGVVTLTGRLVLLQMQKANLKQGI